MFQQAEPNYTNMSSRFYTRHWMKSRTVSKASEYVDATVADAQAKGSRGALFWASRAISNILLNDEEYLSRPKDTEWKDNAFLHLKYGISGSRTHGQPQTQDELQRGTNLERFGPR
jgi:hypothetical protein